MLLLQTCLLIAIASASSALLIDNHEYGQIENNGGEDAWKLQLQLLDDQSASLIDGFVGRVDPKWTPQNGRKNRYAGVQPYGENRVKLMPFHDDNDNASQEGRVVLPLKDNMTQQDDYINASEMKLPKAHRWYIVTQAPLDSTIDDFWRMVYQQNVKNIIMLCHREKKSCATQYWPTTKNNVNTTSGIEVSLIDENNDAVNYTVTKLKITRKLGHGRLEQHNVTHYHYMGWADFRVPDMDSLSTFINAVQPVLNDTTSPTVVHCTGGVGRSGTFILIDSVASMLRNGYNVSLSEQLKELRRLRYGLVETPEQLKFAYEAVNALMHDEKKTEKL